MKVSPAWVVVVVAICAASVAPAEDTVKGMIPGTRECAESASGRFKICNYQNDKDKEPYRSLFLINEKGETKQNLLYIQRGIDVAWAPISDRFFITDDWGSDVSDCMIIIDVAKMKKINVRDLLTPILPRRESHAHHLYFRCSRWDTDRDLIITASGHGGDRPPNVFGFSHDYTLDIESRHFHENR